MRKSKKNSRRGLGNLASYNLIVEGRKMVICSADLAEIQEVKQLLEKINPNTIFIIEDFGVDLEIRPQTEIKYKNFKKVSGYSLWQVLS